MRVKSSLIAASFAAAVVLGTATSPAIAAKKDAAKGSDYQLTDKVRTAVAAAQTAIQASDMTTAAARLVEAQAAISTPDDRLVTGSLQIQVAQTNKDNALLSQGIENVLGSGKAPAANLPPLYSEQASLAINQKDYAKAEAALRKLNEVQPNNAQTLGELSQLAAAQNNSADAATFAQQAVAASKASGQAAPENLYLQQLQSAYESKNAAAVASAGQTLVSTYPSAINWTKALQTYEATSNLPMALLVDVWRLEQQAGAADAHTYRGLVSYASQHGLPGEVKTALDQGVASHKLTMDGDLTAIRAKALSQVGADQAGLAASATHAKSAADGRSALGTADAYASYGQYDQAIPLYELALQKGGVDVPTATLDLGMAQARAGQKDAAKATLAKVTGPAQTLAQYWALWVDHP